MQVVGITGTRERFRSWLSANLNMTYSRYAKLSTEAKRDIQSKYQQKKSSQQP